MAAKEDLEDVRIERQWKNRRRLAWYSFTTIIVVSGIMIFYVPDARIEKLASIVEMLFLTMASIIGAYVGFSSWVGKGK